MNSTMEVIFGLLGGLAVFIFGMNMMSDCLQKAAGERMKSILALLTKNPILGVIAGALTTAVLQSSYDCYGDWFCQCWSYDFAAGNQYYSWCQYWYNYDSTDYSI